MWPVNRSEKLYMLQTMFQVLNKTLPHAADGTISRLVTHSNEEYNGLIIGLHFSLYLWSLLWYLNKLLQWELVICYDNNTAEFLFGKKNFWSHYVCWFWAKNNFDGRTQSVSVWRKVLTRDIVGLFPPQILPDTLSSCNTLCFCDSSICSLLYFQVIQLFCCTSSIFRVKCHNGTSSKLHAPEIQASVI